MRIFSTMALAAFTLSATAAFSAPISYDEAVHGDLGERGAPSSFTLDIGVNTIAGSASSDGNGNSDTDSFVVLTPGTLKVVDGSFFGTVVGVTGGNFNSSGVAVEPSGIFQGVFGAGSTEFAFPEFTDDRGGLFLINPGNGSEMRTISYNFSFTVEDLAPVPLPASGLLLVAGVAGMAVARRRKRS